MKTELMRLEDVSALIINLERRDDRRQHMLAQFDGVMTPLFVSAVDATTMPNRPPDRDTYIVGAGRYLTSSEIACTLSHKRALETFLRGDRRYGLILEDDVVIDFARLSKTPLPCGIDFDFLKLQATPYENRSEIQAVARADGVDVFCRTDLSMGAAAYLVTRAGAGRLIEAISSRLAPADFYLAHHFQYGLRGFEIEPAPARVLFDLASDISTDRPGYRPPPVSVHLVAHWLKKTVVNAIHWRRLARDLANGRGER